MYQVREKIFNGYLIGFDEDHFDVKVMYRDIFFIETIPYTHYCNVFYRNGKCRMYYDAVKLMQHLGEQFIKVSASAIVSVDKIIRIDTRRHFLYLTETLFCTYVSTYWKEIKISLSLHSYRNVRLLSQNKKYIFAYAEAYVLQKIEKSSIVLVESIPACHRCKVISKMGVYEIRGDLSVLEKEMVDYLVKCRRNCLVNMNYVETIDQVNKKIHVQMVGYCGYEMARERELVQRKIMLENGV